MLFRDIEVNKNEYRDLFPYMREIIDITKKENYYENFLNTLYQKNIITKVRKDFYITYIQRNINIMEKIVSSPI